MPENIQCSSNNKNNNRISYLANKTNGVRKLGSKQQHDHEEHIPSRWNKANAIEVRKLTDFCRSHGIVLDGVKIERKYRGSLYQVLNYIINRGCIQLHADLENKQQQTTSFAISGRDYRVDKTYRLQQMQTQFGYYDTSKSSSNYPVFHLNTIKTVITNVCKGKPKGQRSLFTLPDSYLHIILDLSKNVRTSMFDLTGFIQHEFS